jgi:hypothetical protein
VLAIDWSAYPLVAGLVIIGVIVGAVAIRLVMPIKLDITHRHDERKHDEPDEPEN